MTAGFDEQFNNNNNSKITFRCVRCIGSYNIQTSDLDKAKDDSHKHTRVVESNEEEENDVLQVALQKPKKPGPALHHHCKLPRWGSQLSPLL